MPFNGTEGKVISMRNAKSMIAGHKKTKAFAAAAKPGKTIGGFYGKKVLLRILKQRNCVGIRYYHAVNAKRQQTLVLVGEDKEGHLLIKTMVNEGPICPPVCDKSHYFKI